jgi:hypothetical protein
MTVERFWSTIWLFVVPTVLMAITTTLLPSHPVLQLIVLPLWMLYTLLTRPTRQSLWPVLWAATLCEANWDIPPGACITFFIPIWWGVRNYRDLLPVRPSAYHGLLSGVTLPPILAVWIWLYAILWPFWPSATPLMPSLTTLILLPAIGALGGSALFTLAQKAEFLVFIPKPQELREDEG